MKMAELRQQVADLIAKIEEAIEAWELQMDFWSQEQTDEPAPSFGQDFWDRLHSLRGLAPDEAEQYDWVLELGY